ncbi:MAG: 1-phosphofructokinase [Tepidisphaeraceae bacterium]
MNAPLPIITVTLNPAIDQTLSIPNFTAGRVHRVLDSRIHPGGKGVNVAAMLSDLGASVIATGWLGSRNTEPFQFLFARKKIDDQFIRVPGETRMGIKISDEPRGETTDINFPGLRIDAAEIDALIGRLDSIVQPGQWVVLAGSVPGGVDPAIYGRLIDWVHAKGAFVALDTSGAPLAAALDHGPEIAKPNLAELSELCGETLTTPADIVEAARQHLIARGVGLAVVSLGGDGAIFIDGENAVIARPPKVSVKSTVGAGDSMVAGLVLGRTRGLGLEETARLATALGTYAVTRVGIGLDSPEAYQAYLGEVEMTPVTADTTVGAGVRA